MIHSKLATYRKIIFEFKFVKKFNIKTTILGVLNIFN